MNGKRDYPSKRGSTRGVFLNGSWIVTRSLYQVCTDDLKLIRSTELGKDSVIKSL